MLIKCEDDLKLLDNLLAKPSPLAIDIETTGLNPRKDKVIGFGLSDGVNSAYVAHLAWDGEKLVELIPKRACAHLLQRLSSFSLITWNGSFDARGLYHYFGVDLRLALKSDAMLAAHTLDENGGPFQLKVHGKRVFGIDAAQEQKALKENLKKNGAGAKEFYKADLDIMAEYCIQDCNLTLKLEQYYTSKMSDDLLDFYLNREVMPLYREVTIPMEMKGVPLDLDLIRKTDYQITHKLAELEREILKTLAPKLGQFSRKYLNKMYPPRPSGKFAQALAKELQVNLPKTPSGAFSLAKKALDSLPSWHLFKQFVEGRSELPDSLVLRVQESLNGGPVKLNLSSKDQLRYVYFTIFRETPLSFTDRGQPKADSDFLDSIKHKYEFGPLMVEYNKLSKIKSSYSDRFLEAEEDGVFYPSYFQHRTTSGRYGGDLQQLPKAFEEDDDVSDVVRKYTDVVRHFFIAGPGHKLVDADYNSLEVVVFADDAGDEALLDMIRKDYDFYSTVALGVHGLEGEFSADKRADNFLKKHKPTLRQNAKVYGLGIRYGMGDWKLGKTLNIDIKEAALIIEDYFKSYPGLKQKMDFYLNEAKTKGRVVSQAGRVRHLAEAKEIFEQHGDDILDVRKIYQKYPDTMVPEMKKLRKRYNGMLNNALNFPIQSLAASIVNQASIRLARALSDAGLAAYICLNVHDELCIRAPESEVEKIVPLMQDIMENTIKLKAPLTARPNVAYTYGEVK